MENGKAFEFKTEGRQLIHFGSPCYLPKRVKAIVNDNWTKPKGGLWTSPIDSKWGWKDWCKSEDFRECDESNSFRLIFNIDAKILIIDSFKDLIKLPMCVFLCGSYQKEFPDFEFLATQYDAIWLTEKGLNETHLSHPINLYGWDCESVLILNPHCVTECGGVLNSNAYRQKELWNANYEPLL
jgi:hypothetical protein